MPSARNRIVAQWLAVACGWSLLGNPVARAAPVFGEKTPEARAAEKVNKEAARAKNRRAKPGVKPAKGAQPGKQQPAGVKAGAPAPSGVRPGTGQPLAPQGMPGRAVPGGPGPSPQPGGGQQMVSMDFRGTDIDNILKFFSMAANWTITKDPALTGQVTIICPRQVSIEEAFNILQAVLEVRGFTGVLTGTVLKIMPIDRAVQSTRGLTIGPKPDGTLPKDQIVTQVLFPDNASAADLAKELQPLVSKGASILASEGANALIVTDIMPNVERIIKIMDALDQSAVKNELKIFPLLHADAAAVTDLINNLYKPGASKAGQPQQPGMPPGMVPQPGMPGTGGQARSPVVAVSDSRTNAVIVVASISNMERIARLVKQMDGELPEAIQTKIIPVTYADATQLANTLNSVLSASKTGQSAQPGQPQPGQPPMPFEQRVMGGGGAAQPAAGSKVIADTRSNSLIVTARLDEIQMVERLVQDLDKQIKYETTTFIYPLENAQAQDVAYILNQAFGQQQGYGGYYPYGIYFGPSFGGRERRRIQRRASQQGQNPLGGYRGVRNQGPEPPPGEAPPVGLPPDEPPFDPNNPKTRQSYDYYNPFGYGRRGVDTATTGRDPGGRFVNLLQLRNNVLVVADINSNSLILTTTPDNVQAIKEIVKSLDVVPKQVLIEAIVAEATLGTEDKFGLEWKWTEARAFGDKGTTGVSQGKFGVLPGGTEFTQGFKYTVTSAALDAILSAIATDKKVNILSTPRIFTSNNQEAEINISQRIPYVTNIYMGYTGQANYSYDFLDVGIILNVTPRMTKQGLVTIDVYQEANDLIDYISIGGSIQAPRIATRTADTSITVKDGETIIIGGIIKDDRNVTIIKVPILGDLPIIKHLFRSKTATKTKTELMVFLTPRIVSDAAQAASLTAEQQKSIEKIMPLAKKALPQRDGEQERKSP
ncbi:MAG: hypothetical protein IT210_03820 [Armatimonadetes bacterium]|nr:hypothetical protein [Armatimonadota bacterium]